MFRQNRPGQRLSGLSGRPGPAKRFGESSKATNSGPSGRLSGPPGPAKRFGESSKATNSGQTGPDLSGRPGQALRPRRRQVPSGCALLPSPPPCLLARHRGRLACACCACPRERR